MRTFSAHFALAMAGVNATLPVGAFAPAGTVRHAGARLVRNRMSVSHTLASVALGAVIGFGGAMGAVSAQTSDETGINQAAGDGVIGEAGDVGLSQTAADAALNMANMLDGAGGGVSSGDLLSALEDAADAGQPMAMWQLGTMYENGEGVAKDAAKAFGYFSQIANQHADAAPKGVEADIVAQSFVKIGDYYRDGLPGAGIPVDASRSHALLLHAASYFGDADAQYRVGKLYLDENELGVNPLQSARWFSLAARKGHAAAQAQLGNLLFNGSDGIEAQPVEGLMWLTLAQKGLAGTLDEAWGRELLEQASAIATPDQRADAMSIADKLAPEFAAM